jgi:hypothetical protein
MGHNEPKHLYVAEFRLPVVFAPVIALSIVVRSTDILGDSG